MQFDRRRFLVAATVLIILAVHLFTFRQAMERSNDLQPLYVAGRCWLENKSAYDVSNIAAVGAAAGLPHAVDLPFLYPPSALPVLAVFGLFPWKTAKLLYWLCSETALFAMLFVTARSFCTSEGLLKTLLYVLAGAISIPPLASITIANTPILLTAPLALACVYTIRNPLASGSCLALAFMKPQIALSYGLLILVARKRTVLLVAAIVFLGLTCLGCLRAEGSHTISDWLYSVTSDMSLANGNAPNGKYYQNLISYYSAFYWLGLGMAGARKAGVIFSVLTLGATLYMVRDARRQITLRHLALVSVGSLLFLYHHMYDGVGLVFVVGYLLSQLGPAHPRRTTTMFGLVWSGIILFALPSSLVVRLHDWCIHSHHAGLLGLLVPIRTYATVILFLLVCRIASHGAENRSDDIVMTLDEPRSVTGGVAARPRVVTEGVTP